MTWITLERRTSRGPEAIQVNMAKVAFVTPSLLHGSVLWAGKSQMEVIQPPERVMELTKGESK